MIPRAFLNPPPLFLFLNQKKNYSSCLPLCGALTLQDITLPNITQPQYNKVKDKPPSSPPPHSFYILLKRGSRGEGGFWSLCNFEENLQHQLVIFKTMQQNKLALFLSKFIIFCKGSLSSFFMFAMGSSLYTSSYLEH